MRNSGDWFDEPSDKFDEGTPEKEVPTKVKKFGIAANTAKNHPTALTNQQSTGSFIPPLKMQPTSSNKYVRDIGQSGSTSQNNNRRSAGCNSNSSNSIGGADPTAKVEISCHM